MYATFDKDAQKIGNWFQKNYVSGSGPNKKPKYSPSFWSSADSVSLKMPRTQNNLEAWHRRINTIVGIPHVGCYKLVKELGKEYVVVKDNENECGLSDTC